MLIICNRHLFVNLFGRLGTQHLHLINDQHNEEIQHCGTCDTD